MTKILPSIFAIFASVLMQVQPAQAEKQYLFQWNTGSGTTWPGWTYQADTRWGEPGFTRDTHTVVSGQDYPEMFAVGGYGSDNLAVVDSSSRAPSTASGGSFKVYDTGLGTSNQTSWWMWVGAVPFSTDPVTTSSTTNRMDFYLKTDGIASVTETGAVNSVDGDNFHIGTYLCWEGGGAEGQDCPTEADGQHWYHYLTVQDGSWIHVSLDRHPTHKRGACSTDVSGCVPGDNPAYIESGKNYYENINSMYFEIRYGQTALTTMWIDEVGFDTVANENEQSVTSLWVGYWPSDDYWRISWKDMSFQTASGYGLASGNYFSTFEIRYSTSPITNANWDQATPVSTELFSGVAYTGSENRALVRRVGDDVVTVYTKFKLPDNVEENNNIIYFAIKDVSVNGGHGGSTWPWTRLDGHNAPSTSVRTIDYSLRPNPSTGRRYRYLSLSGDD